MNKALQEDQEEGVSMSGMWSRERSHEQQRLQINDYQCKLLKEFGDVTEFDCKKLFWKSLKSTIHIFWEVIPLESQPISISPQQDSHSSEIDQSTEGI